MWRIIHSRRDIVRTASVGGSEGIIGPDRDVRVIQRLRVERQLARGVRWFIAVEDIDHHDGDVVPPAMAVGEIHQLLGERLRILGVGNELTDLVIRHLVHQAVAAEHEAVAAHERQRPHVGTYVRLDAERASDDVATRVRARFLGGDVARGHQLLHVAVIDRDALQSSAAEPVRA